MGTVGIIVDYAVILGGMWFILMRPQKKEQKRIEIHRLLQVYFMVLSSILLMMT